MGEKKILYVTHESDINGASKSLISIIRGLSQYYDMYVLVRAKGSLLDELKQLNCKPIVKPYYLDVEPLYPENIKSRLLWPIRVIRYVCYRNIYNRNIVNEMVKFVKDNDISLVHSNSSSTFIGINIAMLANIPHIWHFREFLKEDFNLQPLLGWEKFYKLSAKSDEIICVSNSVLRKYSNLINTKMVCIYNGIERNNVSIIKKEHEGINILQAGVLSKGKGTDVAVKAIKQLINNGYLNVHLYLAGRGNLDFCRDDYYDVKDNIHLLGFVDMSNVRDAYGIDVELVCSKSEAFGRTTIEAMSYANPVIGSDTAGTKELIIDGETGFLYKQGDYLDLANKIEILIKNPCIISRLGKAAKERFEEKYTIQRCLSEIDQLYREVFKEEC